MYFSKSTLGFYNEHLSAKDLPGDVVKVSDTTYAHVMGMQAQGMFVSADSNGNPIAVAATQADVIAGFAAALTGALDAQARAWQYDSILSASTYVSSAIAKYAAEAKALMAWRDAAWVAADTLLAAVQAGKSPAPVDTPSFLTAVLPAVPSRPSA